MARDFNGTSDKIDMGDATQITGAFPMTVGIWANADVLTGAANHAFISRGSSASNSIGWAFVHIPPSGVVRFTKLGIVAIDSSTTGLRPVVGTWAYHAVVVTSTNVRFIKVALDGTVTAQDIADSNSFGGGTSNKSRIGCTGRTTDIEFFDGRLAEASVFIGQALTDAEVQALALFGPHAVAHQLDGYWPLDGDSTEPDLSGFAKNGTVTGATVASHPPVSGPALWVPAGSLATAAVTAYSIDAQPGSYSVTGSAASIVAARMVNAASGTYAITGTAATTAVGRAINAVAGSYALTGTAASLIAARTLSLDAGTYTTTGSSATLLSARSLALDPGAYIVAGFDADTALTGVFAISANAGSYAVTGTTATLSRGFFVSLDSGTYFVNGVDASFLRGLVASADPGAYVVSGADADLVLVGVVHLELTGYPPILVNPAGGYIQAIDRVEVEV